jgi:hypothetical protein
MFAFWNFHGDLTSWLISTGAAKPWKSWACFHTMMHALENGGNTLRDRASNHWPLAIGGLVEGASFALGPYRSRQAPNRTAAFDDWI